MLSGSLVVSGVSQSYRVYQVDTPFGNNATAALASPFSYSSPWNAPLGSRKPRRVILLLVYHSGITSSEPQLRPHTHNAVETTQPYHTASTQLPQTNVERTHFCHLSYNLQPTSTQVDTFPDAEVWNVLQPSPTCNKIPKSKLRSTSPSIESPTYIITLYLAQQLHKALETGHPADKVINLL